ncbi:YfiR family protein [Arsukibacterium sp.]|uniref:YfiR family protein n=1 Tax=Arsukibacterium sp. TaxID=1977258 RepID=UPI001BD42EE4|nr:YfiR family protein [Arsukibacterium sp.]
MSRLLIALLLAATALYQPALHAQSAQASLKAALLYRFVQYSEWSVNPPVQQIYCIAGDAEVFKALTTMLPEQAQTVLLENAEQATKCTVLFLSLELASQTGWSPLLQSSGRLTVVEGAELFRQGAMFGLIAEPQRISFRVNLTLARQNGFHLSAQMLKLAKEIH